MSTGRAGKVKQQMKTAAHKIAGKDLADEGTHSVIDLKDSARPNVEELGPEASGEIAIRLHAAVEGRSRMADENDPSEGRAAMMIKELCPLTLKQSLEVAESYRKRVGIDLREDLKKHTDGFLRDLLIALVTPPEELVAGTVRETVDRVRTHGRILSEVICLSSPKLLRAADNYYREHYDASMVEDVRSHTRAAFEQVLATLILAAATGNVNRESLPAQVERDVERLHEAGPEKVGKSADVFVDVLCNSSARHRELVGEAYLAKYGKSILRVVKEEFSSDTEIALLFLLRPLGETLAELLHGAPGMLGDDKKLIARILALHRDSLGAANEAFVKEHGMTLASHMQRNRSDGHGRDAVVAMAKLYE